VSGSTRSRLIGLAAIALGLVLAAINVHTLQTKATYEVKSTALSVLTMVLGLGMVIHGRVADATVMAPLSRVYGSLGCGLGAYVLYRLGFFTHGLGWLEYGLIAFLVGFWFLPRRILRPGG
jgi:hypothetical protein